MSDSRPFPGLDARVDAAWPEAADYLDEHPDRLERVARALVERVLAAADRVPSLGLDERIEAAFRKRLEGQEWLNHYNVSLIRDQIALDLEAAGLPQLLSELAEAREENERLNAGWEQDRHATIKLAKKLVAAESQLADTQAALAARDSVLRRLSRWCDLGEAWRTEIARVLGLPEGQSE